MLEGLVAPTQINCSVGRLRADLSKEDQKIFDEACANRFWETKALTIALNERGMPVKTTSLLRHRTGKCRCAK